MTAKPRGSIDRCGLRNGVGIMNKSGQQPTLKHRKRRMEKTISALEGCFVVFVIHSSMSKLGYSLFLISPEK